jgi:hypothetical protein
MLGKSGADAMDLIVLTETGQKLKLREEPRWSDYHKRFYAYGFRWIKTKQAFSTVSVLHNFKSFILAN